MECKGHGRKTCIANGVHSWFNHSMDSYYEHSGKSNLPDNWKEKVGTNKDRTPYGGEAYVTK